MTDTPDRARTDDLPQGASGGRGTVVPISARRSSLPPEVQARWFNYADPLCSSDHDCTPDRLCLGGHCV